MKKIRVSSSIILTNTFSYKPIHVKHLKSNWWPIDTCCTLLIFDRKKYTTVNMFFVPQNPLLPFFVPLITTTASLYIALSQVFAAKYRTYTTRMINENSRFSDKYYIFCRSVARLQQTARVTVFNNYHYNITATLSSEILYVMLNF